MPPISLDAILNSLPGRVGLVVIAAAGAAAASAGLYSLNRIVPGDLLRWGAVALVAVAAGLSARRLLAGRTLALQLWSSLLALLLGLILLGVTTRGAAGATLPAPTQMELNWTWLVQFVFGALLVWLTLSAFPAAVPQKRRRTGTKKTSGTTRKRSSTGLKKKTASSASGARRSEKKSSGQSASSPTSAGRRGSRTSSSTAQRESTASKQPAPPPVQRSTQPSDRAEAPRPSRAPEPVERRVVTPRPRPAPVRRPPVTVHPLSSTPSATTPNPASVTAPDRRSDLGGRMSNLRKRLQTWAQRRSTGGLPERRSSTTKSARAPKTKPATVPVSTSRLRPEGVRLVGNEEHRCPFCLEIVEPGDPRGMVECPICHTQHHADCWAITGICQVPHSHSKG